MPIYIFKNTKTNEVEEKFLSMSEREEYLKDNPDIEQVPTPINIVGGVGGIKPDNGFNEVLSKISEVAAGEVGTDGFPGTVELKKNGLGS